MSKIQFGNSFGFKYRELRSDLSAEDQRSRIITMTHHAIFFQLEGELLISWDEYKDVRVRAGELYFLPRGASISACIVGECVKYVAARLEHDVYSTALFRDVLSRRDADVIYTFSPLPIAKHLEQFVESIKYYIINGLDSQRLQNVKLLELYIIFRSSYNNDDIVRLLYPGLKTSSTFKTFILDNYNVNTTIDDLTKKANMSRSTFDRAFKENFGMTPHKWIDTQTFIKIQRKAAEPNVTVKDMMYEIGVYNSSQFTKLCKRLCGVTPTQLIRS